MPGFFKILDTPLVFGPREAGRFKQWPSCALTKLVRMYCTVYCMMLVKLGKTGCYKLTQVAELYSDQIVLYMMLVGQGEAGCFKQVAVFSGY